MSATLEATRPLAHKSLIDDALWARLTARIREDLEFHSHFGELDQLEQTTWSERILNETLGFLRLCAADSAHGFGPSVLVDIGWHTFILYTRSYAAFCEEIAGRYIHHEPSDELGVDYGDTNLTGTIIAMQQRGIAIDPDVWGLGGDCSNACGTQPCTRCNAGRAAVKCSSNCRNGGGHGRCGPK